MAAREIRRRSTSGRLVSPRSFWCTRGGLIAVVKAYDHHDARRTAGKLFRRGQRTNRVDDSMISVRKASRADLVLWEELLDQQQAGVDGARQTEIDDGQGAMFDVA